MKSLSKLVALIGVVAAATFGVVSMASASTGPFFFLDHYGPLYSGQTSPISSSYNTITYEAGYSTGSAYSGVWVDNYLGTRITADAYCNSPGCVAAQGWATSPAVIGYPVVHNHGNASPSYFSGYVYIN